MPSASTRKAPSDSATLFKRGTVKKGNDGNKWIIVADARGVQRWRKINATAKPNPRTVKTRRGKSARLLAMEADPDTVWGKNKPLEKLWHELASGRKVVVAANTKQYIEFDDDPNIIAVLSSNQSQDAYEVHLYPKAKDKTVEYVIKNYKKFFKRWGEGLEDELEYMKKVMVPS